MFMSGNYATVTDYYSAIPAEVESYAESYSLVEEAECLFYSDTAVVALKTEPMFFRSDRDNLAERLAEDIRGKFNLREVIISFDRDIYYKITKLDAMRGKGVSEDELRPEILGLIQTARVRNNEHS